MKSASEHLLKDALLPYGPFIGIGKPGELRPDGAARAYFEGDAGVLPSSP